MSRGSTRKASSALAAMVLLVFAGEPAAQDGDIRLLGHIGGRCQAVHVEGRFAFIGEGSKLKILDVSHSASPVSVGEVSLPTVRIFDIFVDGSMAYLAAGDEGLFVADVSDPAHPAIRGSYDTPHSARGMAVSGGVAVVADNYYRTDSGWLGSVLTLDVTNPLSPALLASLDTAGRPLSVDLQNGLAFVAADHAGLLVLDVRNPSSPTQIGAFATAAAAWDVHLAGTVAYVPAEGYGLEIVDVANPRQPVRIANPRLPFQALRVSVSGGLAYIGVSSPSALQVVDVSDPASPAVRGSVDLPWTPADVFASGTLAYVAGSFGGLRIIEASNPSSPTLYGVYDPPDKTIDMEVRGDLAYVLDRNDGLHILDVSDPSKPAILGKYPPWGSHWCHRFGLFGDLAFLAAEEGLRILDLSDPTVPSLQGGYEAPGFINLQLVGDLLYVIDKYVGLRILDVSDPSSPTLRGFYRAPRFTGASGGLAVSDGLVYLGRYSLNNIGYVTSGSLEIIDARDPSSPVLLYSYSMSAGVEDIAVVGSIAYMTYGNSLSGSEGFQIVDIGDVTSPTLLSHRTGSFDGFFLAGMTAYLTTTDDLQVLDVANPTSPTLRERFETPRGGGPVFVAGNRIYIGSEGLQILEHRLPTRTSAGRWPLYRENAHEPSR